MNVKKEYRKNHHLHKQMEEEEEEEAEGRDMHQVPGIRDKVMSRHVGTSGPKSRQGLVHSNLSWCSSTCHGPVKLVMVRSSLSWCTKLFMVQCLSPNSHGAV